MKKTFYSIRRRPIMLLEVLISFALIVFCALPLIYPHVAILKSEREFVSVVEKDHLVNLLFIDVIEKLYLNEISFESIVSKKEFIVNDYELKKIGLQDPVPLVVTYTFKEIKSKVARDKKRTAYLFNLSFKVESKDKTPSSTYNYDILIEKSGP